MLIGYNNDVEYRGKEFHIQTEDHGKSTAKIESQIFHQGQILDTEIVSYDSVLDEDVSEEKTEAKLQSLLEATHKGLYKRLVAGEYDEMVGLDPIEEEPPTADPEEFEPSQDRVPNAAQQIEEEGEEAFNQFHENQAQKHVNLDDLKSHLADQQSESEEAESQESSSAASAESGGEEVAETAQNVDLDPEIDDSDLDDSAGEIEPTVEQSSPKTVEKRSPFDDVKSDGGEEEKSEEASGAAVIESRPTPPPESAGANPSESSSQATKKSSASKSGVTKKKSSKKTKKTQNKKTQSGTSGTSSSGPVPSPSERQASSGDQSPSSDLPQTGARAWNGCREPDESLSIVDLVESFLAE